MQLKTENLIFECLQDGETIVGFELFVRDGAEWASVAKTTPLSHVIYQDSEKNRHEADLTATVSHATDGEIKLTGTYTDVDDVTWTLSITFALTTSPNRIKADYMLETSESRSGTRWIGPCLYVGEGSFGSKKDAALFPGLEYLVKDEISSDTTFAAPKYANRATPNAYRITVPMMAVSEGGKAVGMIWDMNQSWGRSWRHPAALFSSPNRLQDDAQNHWLALMAPGVYSRWLNEGEIEAHTPVSVDPGNPATLSAQFVAVPDGDVISVMREWVDEYGLPSLPDAGHDFRANIDLCIESYLDVAWDAEKEGWHHTLADPWGPRFEPILANQLWRYARWPEGNPAWQARARDQVRRALNHVNELPPPHNVPHLELAVVYGQVAQALDGAAEVARGLMADQQDDGSWGWTPDTVADIADFKTEDRLGIMGKEQDSATGLTSSRVRPVLTYAMATGNAEAVESLRKAVDWCNAQQRPEGAQTWELHLHVPDVLAVPYLINMNVAMYQLTREEQYLDQAERWAWTGLPFTFLWHGYYRPVMRYGTVPVFGVTFHDVQSWFGVIVHWNGLWYGDALYRLAQYRQSDGPINWTHLAKGITRHGMQEQIPYGPHKGFYPDAFSTVRGDEEYTWWLNPQLIGLNTFPLVGIPISADPVVLHHESGQRAHITSGATIHTADWVGNTLRLLLSDFTGETNYTLIAAGTRPGTIRCEGVELAGSDNLDSVAAGWQWLDDHQTAVVKLPFTRSSLTVECGL